MRSFLAIVKKEIIDNFRDRRSLFFSLLYGPVLMPLMMMGPMIVGAKKWAIDFEAPKEFHVIGIERAPQLVDFLYTQNLDAKEAPENFEEKLNEKSIQVVLEIPESFAEDFTSGKPASLLLYFNENNDDSEKLKRQVKTLLDQYSSKIRLMRLKVRGIDEEIFKPLHIDEKSVSDEGPKMRFVGHILPFLLLFSMMMGGFYLAVDSTAGERERLSLEPLLSLPLSRFTMVLGKWTAILCFVVIAGLLPLVTSYTVLQFMPLEMFGGMFDFSAATFFKAAVVVLPMTLFISSFLMLVASFAKNTKEAQTHLGVAMMIPMLPFFGLQFMDIPTDQLTLIIPMLSQFKIMELVVLGDAVPLLHIGLSALGCVIGMLVFLSLTLWLYSREKMLMS